MPQVKEFKYLGVLFTTDGKMEWEIDWHQQWCRCCISGKKGS